MSIPPPPTPIEAAASPTQTTARDETVRLAEMTESRVGLWLPLHAYPHLQAVRPGLWEAPQSMSSPAMGDREQALARGVVVYPAGAGLWSFIGVDGSNIPLNRGRMRINLKQLAARGMHASEIFRRLEPELAK